MVEGLEGRTLLSVAPVDPTFNGGQAVITPPTLPTDAATSLNSGSAVAVQADGKIVVVGAINQPGAVTAKPGLAVRRYLANGTLDTTFGTAGEASVTLPDVAYTDVFASADLVIQPDGKLVFTANLATPSNGQTTSQATTSLETVVIRLNQDGSPDSTFGTGGQAVLGASAPNLNQVALQADGSILLGGVIRQVDPDLITLAVAATRLTTDGQVDSSFNGGNLLVFDAATYGTLAFGTDLAELRVNPTGLIDLVWTVRTDNDNFAFTTYQVVELNPDGTPHQAFGTNGLVRGPSTPSVAVDVAVFQPDGKILLVSSYSYSVIRLNADGSPDSTFIKPTLTAPINSIAVQADRRILLGNQASFSVTRLTTSGQTDGTFGPGGRALIRTVTPPLPSFTTGFQYTTGLATTPEGQVVAIGTVRYTARRPGSLSPTVDRGSQLVLARLRTATPVANDYDGDGKADIATLLPNLGIFAIRQSTGGDHLTSFGPVGTGQALPAAGDYDGDGKTDIAAYLPAFGILAYRPSSGGADVLVSFGSAGSGASIPAPGDYDGDGRTDVAVYLPAHGGFAIRPSGGGANYLAPFGAVGVGGSIPAPGDYDGDGRTDLAVYLPEFGTLAYRRSSGMSPVASATSGLIDVLVQFGSAGAGASIPAPGDYDGNGTTDVAVYLPFFGTLALSPSGGFNSLTNRLVPFGAAGSYLTVPAPGDYDGDGITDIAAYLPSFAIAAYRPTTGGPDVLQTFGVSGIAQTVPATSIPYAFPAPSTTSPSTLQASAIDRAFADVPWTDEMLTLINGNNTRKKTPFRVS